ncbi:MAG: glycerophosphodiester phosphodiesterase family protein [Planctomycetia bacterium]|nr:glycerophosphodiester phosphodiesterase family protein [Planctomycetia bacterium]
MKFQSFFLGVLLASCSLCFISAAWADSPQAPTANWTMYNKPRASFTLVAHRGAGDLAPENCLSSLIYSWGLGCVPEVDVRQTSDGHIVMFHDGDFKRVAPDAPKELLDKKISDLTYEQVMSVDIGVARGEQFKGEHVVSIEEIAAALKEDNRRHVVIDVKQVDLQALAEAIYDVRFQCTLTTSDEDLLARWADICPNADGTLWMGLGVMNDEQLEARFQTLREKNFRGINRFHLHVTREEDGTTKPTPEFIRSHGDELRRRGIEFQAMPWPTKTCPNAKTDYDLFRTLLDLGAMGFGADRMDIALKALDDFYADAPDDWNIVENIPLDEVVIMGHRGLGNEAPEGTIQTFIKAWNQGICPEADVRTTKDGVIVSFHDDNFARILKDAPQEIKNKGVKDCTLEELRELKVGAYMGEQYADERIVTLAEIVEELKKDPKRLIFCDLKNIDLQQFARETQDVHPQICLTDPDYNALVEWKKIAPRSKTLIWTPTTWSGTPEDLEERFNRLRDVNFDALDFVQVHVTVDVQGNVKPGVDVLRRCANATRRHGVVFEVITWTNGDKEKSYQVLLDAGVASFATDFPTKTQESVAKYYQSHAK